MSSSVLSHVILFVRNPLESGAFYSRLLNLNPVEQSPTFVLFALSNGIKLGLWSQATTRPEIRTMGNGGEICLMQKSDQEVDDCYAKWLEYGISMAQAPLAMDGMSRTFVALDPDGHRIRVFCFGEEMA